MIKMGDALGKQLMKSCHRLWHFVLADEILKKKRENGRDKTADLW